MRAEFPFANVGFAEASIVPGGSIAATLSGDYNWAKNTVEYEGQYKVAIFVGVRFGFEHEVKLLNVGASLFGELGLQFGNTFDFIESKWGEWKAGGYLRGVAEYQFGKSHAQRYEYKESFGGDVHFF